MAITNKVWTVAVVGCGIGRAHIEGYKSHPDKFRVAALCDLDEKRLAAVGDEFRIDWRTRSFDELLGMDDVEIIDICTPPGLHVSQIIAALAAGKDVICEKPLSGSLADIDRVIAAEQEAAGRVMPIFQYRFGAGVQKAKRIVELGGVLLTHAIHSHDLLTWLMGPVASVFARTATRVNPVEVEDCAVASLVMQGGALAALAVTLGSQKEISRLRLCFEHATFESSLAPYSPGDDPWEIVPASEEIAHRIGEALADHRFVRSGFEGLMGAYHAALATGGTLPVTLADARRSIELVTALYHSAATGSAVSLPIAPDHPGYNGWRSDRWLSAACPSCSS